MSNTRYTAVLTEEPSVASLSNSFGSTGMVARKMSAENKQDEEPILMSFQAFMDMPEPESKKEKSIAAGAATQAAKIAKATAKTKMAVRAKVAIKAGAIEARTAAEKIERAAAEAKAAVESKSKTETPSDSGWDWGKTFEAIGLAVGSSALFMYPVVPYQSNSRNP